MKPVDIPAEEIPFLTTRQMIEVDRLMTAEYGIDLVRMMENAGRNLARLAVDRFFDGDPSGKRVTVLAGTGGNGGGVLVAARRLHAWGACIWRQPVASMWTRRRCSSSKTRS